MDFKEELTQKLIDQGLDPSLFRITSSAVKIDTTNLNGWYVYDHYYNQTEYDRLRLSADQKKRQPFRQADTSYDNSNSSSIVTIKNVFLDHSYPEGSKELKSLWRFNQHTYSYMDNAGKSNMIFAGYGSRALVDFMLYPAASDTRRTFSFDMDASRINTHTLTGAGFLMNASVNESGLLNGYLLYYTNINTSSGTANVGIRKVTNFNAKNSALENALGSYSTSPVSTTLGSTKKARISVDLQKDKVTVQQQAYNPDGTLGEVQTLFGGPVAIDSVGGNGFGPLIGYQSHSCSDMTSYQFTDLEMNYEASSFDALKNVQYYENAEYKYFINLAGTKNDPQIPKDENDYLEGIQRLNKNETFYLSNSNDGKVLTNPTNNSTGLGENNGLYATGQDPIGQMAEFIANRYKEQKPFEQVDIVEKQDVPVADFFICKAEDKNEQVLTLHLQHLKTDSDRIELNIHDKSFTGKEAEEPNHIVNRWKLKVYDPNNKVIYDSSTINNGHDNEGYVDNPNKLTNVIFNKTNSMQGRYVFELQVKDAEGHESGFFQTYLVAYKDNVAPKASIKSQSSSSTGTITITDEGPGIADDGIEIIAGQGSGVAAYQIKGQNKVTLDKVQHSVSVNTKLTNEDIEITVWDECGNEAVYTFETAKVSFDKGQHPPYYVIQGQELGALPEGPQSNQPGESFQGWTDSNGELVTPGTTVNGDIVLSPSYTTETVTITFNPNGGTLPEDQAATINVPKGSPVASYLPEKNPVREGYDFVKWTLNGGDVNAQTVTSNITLVAQWNVKEYVLKFDANGGSLGRLKQKDVNFGTNLYNAVTYITGSTEHSGADLPSRPGYSFRGWSLKPGGVALNSSSAEKMPAKTTTVYAVWEKTSGSIIVSFDTNGSGEHLPDQAYTANAKYASLPTPHWAGYDFEGWYYDENKVTDGLSLKVNSDHMLTAKWTAHKNTAYDIVYYKSTDGTTDGYTEYYRTSGVGTTGTEISVPEQDIEQKLKELNGDTDTYWFDESHSIVKGKITGSPKLQLKVYFSRYFTVTTEKSGNGTVSPTKSGIKEWSNYEVTWEPAEGYYVSRVVVDGSIRDDLRNSSSYNFSNIRKDHRIYVEFMKGEAPDIGGGESTNQYYTVNTKIEGCSDSRCTISPSKRVKAGSDYKVEWILGDGYRITKVTLDGREYPGYETLSYIDLQGILSNHEIVVTVEKLPTAGGGGTGGHYTVTVNRYGGDTNCNASPSTIVKPGATENVDWKACDKHEIHKVYIDGVLVQDGEGGSVPVREGQHSFVNIHENHVVDIYFKNIGGAEVPDYGGKDKYKVTTQIIGGSGTITGGGIVERGTEYEVSWTIADEIKEYYVIDRVTVNGRTESTENNSLKFIVDSDKDVKVYLKPIQYKVITDKYGAGTIDASKVLFKGKDYLNLEANPESGSYIAKVYIDSELIYACQQVIKSGTSVISETIGNEENAETSPENTPNKPENEGQNPQAGEGLTPPGDNPENMPSDNEPDIPEDGIGDEEPGKPESEEPSDVEYEFIEENHFDNVSDALGELYVKSVNQDGLNMNVQHISNDHEILVIFAKDASVGGNGTSEPEKAPDIGDLESLHQITGEIIGGIGEITGTGYLKDGEDASVSWDIAEGYEITKVTVNGKEVSIDGNRIDFSDVTKDQHVQIYVEPKVPGDDKTDGGNFHVPEYKIDTEIIGGGGSITPDAVISKGGSYTVSWNVDLDDTSHSYEIKDVIVDGQSRPDLINKNGTGQINFNNIDRNHKVVVVIGLVVVVNTPDKPGNNINIDTDGDGRPDINVDINGDGIPDVNVDTGNNKDWKPGDTLEYSPGHIWKPDTDIDKNGDGKGDSSDYREPIDKDGDGVDDNWKPDHNVNLDNGFAFDTVKPPTGGGGIVKPPIDVDTDGDGKPDINIDTDGDGKPDVNIDTDGDGKPDVDIDTDGDGKPDVDIDTDGDGKPDINIDTDGDGKPDVDIDTDGDGKPDVNIDTDGDGKPDVNIDTDGDGKPDVDIDTDGDGKPDVNIDTDGDGKPDVDIDTDGDGKPDVNIDTDGDGKPDVNIDTDGDGEPDVNIDTDGDGEPDVNIDTDGDGEPDVNIDTDGDGEPDINIDTDGDGEPDKNIAKGPNSNPDMNLPNNGTGEGSAGVQTSDRNLLEEYLLLLAAAIASLIGLLRKRKWFEEQ